jgi:hypothetical protein
MTANKSMIDKAINKNLLLDTVEILRHTQRQRVSDGEILPILTGCESLNQILIIVLPQLGDFDSMEYAWWLQRESLPQNMAVRVVGIGDRTSGKRFCEFTGLILTGYLSIQLPNSLRNWACMQV